MSAVSVRITPFDPHRADEAEWTAFNALKNRIEAELSPEDPPVSVEDHARSLRASPPSMNSLLWIAWAPSGSQALAIANFRKFTGETNRHAGNFRITVLQEERRRGVATRLLRPVAEAARKMDRRLLFTSTTSRAPAGDAFMRRIGGAIGLTNSASQLHIAELDRDLMRAWRERARERASRFELGFWEGPYPDEDVGDVLKMMLVMNTAPRGDLDIEDFEHTAELLREWEASMAKSRTERWTLYARDLETGRIAGYTDVFWNPARPKHLIQGDTGVFPVYRGRGLGRWLKADMVERVLRDRPQVERVQTENAATNAPMLKINREMGFVHHKTLHDWQVDVERVLEYLGSRSA